MNFEDALVSREVRPINADEVEVIEVWDPNHPSCPFFSWHGLPKEPFGWRTVMSSAQWNQIAREKLETDKRGPNSA